MVAVPEPSEKWLFWCNHAKVWWYKALAKYIKPFKKNLKWKDVTAWTIEEEIFPDAQKLKTAKITPIFQAGDENDLRNYRLISVLPCFWKYLNQSCIKDSLQLFIRKQFTLSKAVWFLRMWFNGTWYNGTYTSN